MVEPDRVADDVGRESISVIARRLGLLCHSSPQPDNTARERDVGRRKCESGDPKPGPPL